MRRGKAEAEDAVARSKYSQALEEAKRQARVEYHDQFRAQVLAVVGEGHEQPRNPQDLKDFTAVETLLLAAKPVSGEDVAAFKDFVQRFAGWLKAQEINAPPDMTDALGAKYEDEQARGFSPSRNAAGGRSSYELIISRAGEHRSPAGSRGRARRA